jgi:triosephosphate isomerase (TIM)
VLMEIQMPVIITNFKTYEGATGAKALELARVHEKVSKATGISMAVAVQLADLRLVAEAVSIPVFAQHIDPVRYGSNTGYVLPEAVKEAGAYGTLLNHSERQIGMELLKASIEAAQAVGLTVVACAQDHQEADQVLHMGPEWVAVEPPDLIGGDISVSTSQPELIRAAVELHGGNSTTLVGAGVKNAEDVRIAIELGACGVLLASGVTKADDPESVLRDLASGALAVKM